jgi:glycosyltransferase involved in cell wall biosynthesis
MPPSATEGEVECSRRHASGRPYILLPNQFWAHKNHRIVITALKLLRQRNQRVLVLATGPTSDYRNPAYFEELMSYAKDCDVLESFRVLGVISSSEVLALMRHAAAVINPSHFEGWSTSVEEAKALGKTIILSDIKVHREQSPERAIYFDPADAEGLSQALWTAVQEFDPAIDRSRQERARAGLVARQMEFAETFQRIALDSVNAHRAVLLSYRRN